MNASRSTFSQSYSPAVPPSHGTRSLMLGRRVGQPSCARTENDRLIALAQHCHAWLIMLTCSCVSMLRAEQAACSAILRFMIGGMREFLSAPQRRGHESAESTGRLQRERRRETEARAPSPDWHSPTQCGLSSAWGMAATEAASAERTAAFILCCFCTAHRHNQPSHPTISPVLPLCPAPSISASLPPPPPAAALMSRQLYQPSFSVSAGGGPRNPVSVPHSRDATDKPLPANRYKRKAGGRAGWRVGGA
eukprot:COSAG03_NODE_450_length_7830_cov_5.709352_2_plen_250_part_00